ncbi:MAG: hypothetical protein JSW11_02760 [Candidatus Heimdallarchaeota archaeon]|nr:MAG: hypothetical protein JSW11_02760 [Candidatus Heimdallarchaeota archaeon]
MKKLKCVFIDAVDDRERRIEGEGEPLPPYSTFYGYYFNQYIESRVKEAFGWSTDLLKTSQIGGFDVSIHIITLSYLQRFGVAQHFYSPHGPKYDDKYSYLHGMNLLTFEGYNRVHLIYSIKRLNRIFQEKRITSLTKKRRKSSTKETPFLVPVDYPRIGILTPKSNLKASWILQLKELSENIKISDNILDLVPDIHPDDFVDYSLSRSYKYTLDDYIPTLNSILETI